jgi:hypothetical protein
MPSIGVENFLRHVLTVLHHALDLALLYGGKLATLVDTVPIEGSLKDLRFRGVPRERFMSCDDLGVPRLKTSPRRWQ